MLKKIGNFIKLKTKRSKNIKSKIDTIRTMEIVFSSYGIDPKDFKRVFYLFD